MVFSDRLSAAIVAKRTPLMVGLDPRLEQLPPDLQLHFSNAVFRQGRGLAMAEAYEKFCAEILEVVAPLVAVVKPQMAFFEACGPHGMSALGRLLSLARQRGLQIVLDGKRGDIGSTAEAYAAAYLGGAESDSWHTDALTVNPWLGLDSLAPFVNQAVATDSGIFVLVKTSNPGSRDYQECIVDHAPLFQRVAEHVERLAIQTIGGKGYGAIGAVVGATYPEELAKLRQIMPHTWFLIPGFGAQGGTAADVAAGFDSMGQGAIVNSSRNIIFAYDRPAYRQYRDGNWQRAVELATVEAIDQLADQTSAGQLRVDCKTA